MLFVGDDNGRVLRSETTGKKKDEERRQRRIGIQDCIIVGVKPRKNFFPGPKKTSNGREHGVEKRKKSRKVGAV
jgi:hypothetical protein